MSTVLRDPRAVAGLLRTQPLFHTLSEADGLELAAVITVEELTAGQILFSVGEASEDLYMITQGQLRVTVPGPEGVEVVVGVARSGDLLGEMGLFDGSVRSATARAVAQVQVVRLPGPIFLRLLASGHPAVRLLLGELSHRVSQRIREVNRRLEAVFVPPSTLRLH